MLFSDATPSAKQLVSDKMKSGPSILCEIASGMDKAETISEKEMMKAFLSDSSVSYETKFMLEQMQDMTNF